MRIKSHFVFIHKILKRKILCTDNYTVSLNIIMDNKMTNLTKYVEDWHFLSYCKLFTCINNIS